jgi:preprotein translocase subunit SecE
MASKREKQGEQLIQADQRHERSTNRSRRPSRPTKPGGKRTPQSDKATDKAADKQAKTTASSKATDKAPNSPVNREMKRMMAKREGAADRLRRPTAPPRGKRTKPLAFVKEVRGELARVAWPTRPETITYTLVVIVTVAFFMIVIGAIDFVALKGVLLLIGRGGR